MIVVLGPDIQEENTYLCKCHPEQKCVFVSSKDGVDMNRE